ncbi:uncharacterized protein VP01_675g1 [Puccinia sorghi]|uniref:Arf3-interacting protein 1 N-terminal domain-containing protein n=1 Tax=Puccinia sorghi TaxID=27349 RepID=A0A0L6UEK7_9BASI|nr:uncharacterized protein VP01_675g1 [Puccinia sorghi]
MKTTTTSSSTPHPSRNSPETKPITKRDSTDQQSPQENPSSPQNTNIHPDQQDPAAHYTSTPHAAYVLLAEFDIDTGSGLKHQYPSPTGTAEHILADLMLPDGAHDRNEDWTVFFLNQTPRLSVINNSNEPNQPPSTPTPHQPQHHLPSLDSNPSIHHSPPLKTDPKLLYVISLVRTKKDTSVRSQFCYSHSKTISSIPP